VSLVILAFAAIALYWWRHAARRRREERRLVRDYLEAHSFPGDSVADVLTEHGDVSLAEVRRISEAYRAGWRDCEEKTQRARTRRTYR
jgi:hypothetical protein